MKSRYLSRPWFCGMLSSVAVIGLLSAASSRAMAANAEPIFTDPNIEGLGFGQLDPFVFGAAYSQDDDASGEIIATSSPRGGRVVYWDAATGRVLGTTPLADGCGVAPLGDGVILATSGRGAIRRVTPGTESEIMAENGRLAWDNHIRRL